MKKFALALIPALISSAAMAQFVDNAQVVSVTPINDRVSAPRQECWTEQVAAVAPAPVRAPEPVRYAPTTTTTASSAPTGVGAVLGAIIGGVVGHQMGNSTGGRDHGTVAGAVVGGLIGHGIESSSTSNTVTAAPAPVYNQGVAPAVYQPEATGMRTVERCRTVQDSREQVSGYNVTYRYGNQEYTSRMATNPGSTVRVRVTVTPEVGALR